MEKREYMRMAGSEGLEEATTVLSLLSHGDRLRVLCNLSTEGELTVGQLLERVELSGPALSQHLSVLRDAGVVETRRQSQTIYYRLSDPQLIELLSALCELSGSMAER